MMHQELHRQPAQSQTGGTGIAGIIMTATAPTHTRGCCQMCALPPSPENQRGQLQLARIERPLTNCTSADLG